jgi:hypothetical protein
VRRHALLFPAQFWLLVGGTYLYLVGYEIGYLAGTHSPVHFLC